MNNSSKQLSTFITGRFVSFSARYAEHSSAVSCRPCLKAFHHVQEFFFVICYFSQSIKFCVRSFDNCIFLFVDSDIVGSFPLPPIFRCLQVKYSQKMMLLLRSFLRLSEHNLRNCQLHEVETEWRRSRQSGGLRDSWSMNN